MKTMILTAALAVLTAITFAQTTLVSEKEVLSGNDNIKVAMYPTSTDQVTFIVMKQPDDKLNLKIRDEKGNLVYEKRLCKPSSRKITFDMHNLAEGNYTFELAKGKLVLYSNGITLGSETLAFQQ
jgi:hypothetical protein